MVDEKPEAGEQVQEKDCSAAGSEETSGNAKSLGAFSFEGDMSLAQAIPLGLQHVLAMFVGNLTPLLIVTGACGLAGAEFADVQLSLLQNAMFPAEKNWQLDLDGANRCADELIAFVKTVKNAVVVSDFIYSDAQRYDETTELYRKSLAAINRRLAAACDVVAEVAAGNPRLYKGALPL